MGRLRERWTLLREGEPLVDPSTGNRIPTPPTEYPWTGLLQQRFPETKQDEFEPGHVASELVLLLDPGIPGGVGRRDRLRYDGPLPGDIVPIGGIVQIAGTPRPRRPKRGGRRPAYIAAIVRHASDMKE